MPAREAAPIGEAALLHHGGRGAREGAWGSLGLWPDADAPAVDYATACAALARELARAADLRRGARVLAPGCGAGEELRLWRDEFAAAELVGVEPDPARHAAAAAAGIVPTLGIRLLQGDALQMQALAGSGFDAVLACDSAYHFGRHAHWLAAAAAALAPGGRIAFTDLVLEPQGPGARALAPGLAWLLARRAVGVAELRSVQFVGQALAAAGFVEVRCRRLDHAVLDGFVRFVSAQRRRLGPLAGGAGWRRVAATARALPVCRRFGLGYALFSARRADS